MSEKYVVSTIYGAVQGGVVGGASETPCSEDCLYLNVYTPAIDGK